ncbi:MAG: hypothetical protein RSB67_02430 [Clostridia bacterium]
MNFVKGTMIGMFAGAVVGAMNSNTIMKMYFKGRKGYKKMIKRYGF